MRILCGRYFLSHLQLTPAIENYSDCQKVCRNAAAWYQQGVLKVLEMLEMLDFEVSSKMHSMQRLSVLWIIIDMTNGNYIHNLCSSLCSITNLMTNPNNDIFSTTSTPSKHLKNQHSHTFTNIPLPMVKCSSHSITQLSRCDISKVKYIIPWQIARDGESEAPNRRDRIR